MEIRKDLFTAKEIAKIKAIKTPFDDIINLDYPFSTTLEKTSLIDKACQFAPFAALTGYDEKIDEAGRIVDKKLNLDENQKQQLDEKIKYLLSLKQNPPFVKILYFIKDEKKEGGSYKEIEGKIKKIYISKKQIIMENDLLINARDIFDITILEK